MTALSINLRVANRFAIVAGGGRVAARRASVLLSAGARVRMIAPTFSVEARAIADQHLTRIERPYESADLGGAFLAVAATNDQEVNARVCADATAAGILCSNATQPQSGEFTFPAAAHHGRITIAVDTGGASPELAKKILKELSARLDAHAPDAAETLALMRHHAYEVVAPIDRSRILRGFADLPLATLASLSADDARKHVEKAANESTQEREPQASKLVTCASRGSRLALTQTAAIASALEGAGIASRILTIATRGDLSPDRPLSSMDAENIFVKEIETALLERRADYAVHSCKDLPSMLDSELQLVAISAREDPRDAFCSERFASFYDLPAGARVGTSSIRRRAQLMSLRADLDYVDCRGNVDTRLRKLRDGEFDALVLAMAGLQRLGAMAPSTIAFETDEIVPAVGQGALAVEMRRAQDDLHATIRHTINDRRAELAIVCERSALAALGGGCNTPIGIYAQHAGRALNVKGIVCSHDGSQTVTARTADAVESRSQAASLGEELAAQLLASGAAQLLGSQAESGLPIAGRLILLPRTQTRDSRIAPVLERAGARVLQVRGTKEARQALAEHGVDMVVFASSGAVDTVGEMFRTWRVDATRPAIAAMGEASAAAATAHGVAPDIVAEDPSVESLLLAVQRYFKRGAPAR